MYSLLISVALVKINHHENGCLQGCAAQSLAQENSINVHRISERALPKIRHGEEAKWLGESGFRKEEKVAGGKAEKRTPTHDGWRFRPRRQKQLKESTATPPGTCPVPSDPGS